MMKLLGGLSLAALSFASAVQAQSSLAEDAVAFGSRAAVVAPDLSPDGSKVLYLTPGPGPSSVAVIADLVGGKSQVVVRSDGKPESLRWCRHVASSRVVCRISGVVADTGEIIGFARLFAVDANGANPKLLGQTRSAYDAGLRQYDGAIIDWLGGTDGKVLMSRQYVPEAGRTGSNIVRTKSGLAVDQVDSASLRSEPVESARPFASSYMSDGHGKVRLMEMAEVRQNGNLTGRVKYLYRAPGSSDWKGLVDFQDEEFVPLAIDGAANRLFALKKKDGRYALYGVALDDSLAATLVAENPRVDIDDVVRAGDGGKVIGYTFAEDKRTAVYFDPQFKSLAASLSKSLPKLPIVDFVDASNDGQKLLVFAGSDSDPGRYYVFDRTKKTLNEAMLARPKLEGKTLATVKSVTITAPDGVAIPAYLTLPAGREARGLPAVVLPHGGPSSRDEWGFDWLPQFLAARGYAVLQPQYRGSAGFGDAWLNKNGFKNWRTSIGDISASARWLAAQGIADPKRLAIVGWSYGGYAALQSAATEPSLYKAVVAIAPVSDLQMYKQDFANFTNERVVADFVGSGPHVAEGSPLRNAAAISVPVLLFHGDLDSNVRIAHSKKMDAALRDAGRNSELVTFKGLDHQLDDSAARIEMLNKIGALLDRTTGR